jgi:predicted O-methyltransferase YrrM
MQVIAHPESWVEAGRLGAQRPYRATYVETGLLGPTFDQLLRSSHQPESVSIDFGIPGSLEQSDALKLYELAYFGTGDVLEIGCGAGLATTIVALAIAEADRFARIVSVDLDSRMMAGAQANPLVLGRVQFVRGEPVVVCGDLVRDWKEFGLVFVHHSQAYPDMRALCELLVFLVQPGGFVLFQSFNDRRNRDGNIAGGVYAGVVDGLAVPPFAFYGVFGTSGLYRWEVPSE